MERPIGEDLRHQVDGKFVEQEVEAYQYQY
jgi:hypothetical protein